jgi:hypothetical protein
MGKIIGTCGHELEGEWAFSEEAQIYIKSFTRENEKSFDCIWVCPKCRCDYLLEGLILHNEREQDEWLNS